LEESLSLFQRGMELVQYLSKLLDEAELKVKSLTPQPGGGFEVEDYPQEEE
ncbi:MAG: exodeoxyribonuclease VII small subunit, partial [Chloroflexi bacterium]|nr:exodeoxyribonuclease VII small subunit [Chloroflexota bacterium]